MEIQERDTRIIEFIRRFKVTTVRLTSALYFPNRTTEPCRKRLQGLYQNRYIDRDGGGFGRENVFYPKGHRRYNQVETERRLAVTRFYVELVKATQKGILHYETYTKVDYAPFDLIVHFRYNQRRYLVFVNSSFYKKYPKDKIIKWYNDSKLFKKYIQENYGMVDAFCFVNLVDRNIKGKSIKSEGRFNVTELDIQSDNFLQPLLNKLKEDEPQIALRKVITTS